MKKDYENMKVKKSKKKYQIVVLGSSKSICTKEAYYYAFEVGQEIARKGHITLTGGGYGVMEAALKGAKKKGGVTFAIVPWENKDNVNDYADFTVATGIGWSRNSININSCDGAIIVGGGAGTLNEATYAYMMRKPTVAVTPSGGMAEELTDKIFDSRNAEIIIGTNSAKEAVNKIIELIEKQKNIGFEVTEFDKELMSKVERDKLSKMNGKIFE